MKKFSLTILAACLVCLQCSRYVSSGENPRPLNARMPTDGGVMGFTEPVKTVKLAASETGTLARLDVRPGSRVSSGVEIGSLDIEVLTANRALAVSRHESKARLKAARIRLERARDNYEKLRQLRDEGHGGKRELEIAIAEFELARTDIEAVTEEMQLARLDIDRIDAEIRRRRIVSSIDGIVAELHREVGEYVSSADPNVLTIVNLQQLRIRLYVPTVQAEAFRVRDELSIRFLHNQKTQAATIDFIAPVIDADSDTIRIDVLLDNKNGRLRSGRRCVLVENSHRPQTRDSVESTTRATKAPSNKKRSVQ